MDAVLVRWPREAERRELLVQQSVPRLLLVEDGQSAPDVMDCLEDWVRVPSDEDEVRTRLVALSARSRFHAHEAPELDSDGVLRFATRWVALPPVEARLTAALLGRFGAVVSRGALARSGWPDGAPRRNALDVHVVRLRRRLAPIGLAIRTVRSRGYLLEPSESVQTAVREA